MLATTPPEVFNLGPMQDNGELNVSLTVSTLDNCYNINTLDTKLIGQFCTPNTELSENAKSLNLISWNRFWNLDIQLSIRSILQKIIPSKFSANCLICQNDSIEIMTHFIYECPKKNLVWKEVWNKLHSKPFSNDIIHKCIFYLEIPSNQLEIPTRYETHIGNMSLMTTLFFRD